jgi:HSP20 family protein
MYAAPPTSWRPFTVPCGRRLSARFDSGVRGEGNFYVPSMQVDVEDDAYVITARIPGAERDELEVCLCGGVLRVSGERRQHSRRRNGNVQEDTRYLSRFTREVGLTRQVDPARVEAHFENGLLTMRLPVVAAPPPQEDTIARIDIA